MPHWSPGSLLLFVCQVRRHALNWTKVTVVWCLDLTLVVNLVVPPTFPPNSSSASMPHGDTINLSALAPEPVISVGHVIEGLYSGSGYRRDVQLLNNRGVAASAPLSPYLDFAAMVLQAAVGGLILGTQLPYDYPIPLPEHEKVKVHFRIEAEKLVGPQELALGDIVLENPSGKISDSLFLTLKEGLRLYNQWRHTTPLNDVLYPWHDGLTVVWGRAPATCTLRESGRKYFCIDSNVLNWIMSPEVMVFYLRHRRQLDGFPLKHVMNDDALFLLTLKFLMSDEDYRELESQLKILFDHWDGKKGYLELLHRLADGDVESDQSFAEFFAERLANFGEVPLWDMTVNARVINHLAWIHTDPALINALLLEAMLNEGGVWAQRPNRQVVRRLFVLGPNARLDQRALKRFGVGGDMSLILMGINRMGCMAATMWAQLNPHAVLAISNPRYQFLHEAAAAFAAIERFYSHQEAGSLDHRLPMIIFAEQLPGMLDQLDRPLAIQTIQEYLDEYPESADLVSSTLGRVVANRKDLRQPCLEIAREFEARGVKTTAIDEVVLPELEQAVEAMLTRIREAAMEREKDTTEGSDYGRLAFVMFNANRIHAGDRRKDNETHEFWHQLKVHDILLVIFHISDFFLHEIASVHDSLESGRKEYHELMKQYEEFVRGGPTTMAAKLAPLAVRMLTYLPGYPRSEQERLCYEGLVNPHAVYGHMPEFQEALTYLREHPDEERLFLLGLQIVKMADRLANLGDFDYLFKERFIKLFWSEDPQDAKSRAQQIELPDKTIRKTVNSLNRKLVNHIVDPDIGLPFVEAFYTEFVRIVDDYIHRDISRDPQAQSLVDAAKNNRAELLQTIREHPLYDRSRRLRALVEGDASAGGPSRGGSGGSPSSGHSVATIPNITWPSWKSSPNPKASVNRHLLRST